MYTGKSYARKSISVDEQPEVSPALASTLPLSPDGMSNVATAPNNNHRSLEYRPTLSVVVPVYRSVETLPSIIAEIRDALASTWERTEILLVDDASGQETWQTILRLTQQHPAHIIAIRLAKNVGQHHAVLCGLRVARGEFVVTIDDDLQHPPAEIHKLWNYLTDYELDVVYAGYRRQHGFIRNLFGIPFLRWARWAYDVPVLFSSFRILRRSVVDHIATNESPHVLIDPMILAVTKHIADVPVNHRSRQVGSTSYSIRKLIKLALTVIACAPRRRCRLFATLLSIVGGAAFLASCWLTATTEGWTALCGFVFLIGSMFGLLGLATISYGTCQLRRNTTRQYEMAELVLPNRATLN